MLHYCEILLEEKNWELGVVAYDWAYRMKKQYTEEIFSQFESWLYQYVTGWGDCDDFCTHAFGELLIQYPQFYDKLFVWCKSEKFWVRRAAAVILILPIKKGKSSIMNPLLIADELMMDSHDLVQKGYGWMLKMYSMQEKEKVKVYLDKNRNCMPRTAFRYALEKMEPEERKFLMT